MRRIGWKLPGLLQRLGWIALIVAWPLSAAPAEAPFPSKLIRVVVPYAAGGAVDIVTRVVSEKMAPRSGADDYRR